MAKIVINHDDELWDVVCKISSELERFGLIIAEVSEDGTETMDYEIVVLK